MCAAFSGTQLSAAFAPGLEKIAHSDFTCELENNMKADFSAGVGGGWGGVGGWRRGRGEACGGGATSSLPKCSAALRVALTSFLIFNPPS